MWRDGTPEDASCGEMVPLGVVAVDKWTRARVKVGVAVDSASLQHSSTSLA